ncbi:MAG TPA: tetratricopeptide repeat protein [Ktedonobacteraceae bacterium]|nr:tetratricopeptide repeat protein [Ktedonobacteraceae bacterium]
MEEPLMPKLPTGTVTYLFTDIEGSTERWERHPEVMRAAVAQHDVLLRSIIEAHRGSVFKTAGDAFYVAFAVALDALTAAVAAQRALAAETWPTEIRPLRVRMAIHTGAAEQRNNDYFGQALNRVARILSAGHGGQILLSGAAQGLVSDILPQGVTLRDLGEHQLKDIQRLEQIFQVAAVDLPFEFPPLRTLDSHPNNLPIQMTPFVGRERALETVAGLLRRKDVRLVTLIGPGGIGKTRLGLQIAADVVDAFPNGVFFVDLSTTREADAVLSAINQTIGIREVDDRALLEHLKDLLSGQALLLLDNFEQVIDAAPLIVKLLVLCLGLKVLVTSRAALSLSGEHEYHVLPLTLPTFRPPFDLAELSQYEAIALFLQQARSVKSDFQLTLSNATAIIEICKSLDGLPLAIELAAAHIKLLPPQAMLKRLEHRLRLPKGEWRDRTERQQTLRGAIAWSYDLLDDDEKKMFVQLAVFNGGCTFEAIVAICPIVENLVVDLLDVLNALTDKSLLRPQEQENDEPRFTMLHTIRDFALEQLSKSGDAEVLRHRHFTYYLSMAEEAASALMGSEQRRWLEQLECEHDNLLAALWWCVENAEIELGLQLAGALWRFWLMRGYLHEGRYWLDKFLLSEATPMIALATRARVLKGASVLACRQKDYERAVLLADEALALGQALSNQEILSGAYTSLAEVAYMRGNSERAAALFEENLKIRRTLSDRRGTASLLNNLGNVLLQQGALERATSLFEECLSLFRMVGDELALASVLNNLGEVERQRGNHERAFLLYEESLKLSRGLKYTWGIAASLTNLGAIARNQGNYRQALGYYKESLSLFYEMGEKLGIALCFEGLAEVEYAQHHLEYSVRLLTLAEMLRQSIGTDVLQFELPAHESLDKSLRSALGHDAFETLWRTGRMLSLDQAITDALAIENNDLEITSNVWCE